MVKLWLFLYLTAFDLDWLRHLQFLNAHSWQLLGTITELLGLREGGTDSGREDLRVITVDTQGGELLERDGAHLEVCF